MYSDGRKTGKGRISAVLAAVVTVAVLAAILVSAFGRGERLDDNALEAIRATVQRTALQCYAVEGIYPPSLEYLEENYGLQVNTGEYYVVYEAFASNLPPTVRVMRKQA